MEDIFSKLEGMHGTDPKKYMDLVKTLRNGDFDKQKQSDTSAVSPEDWFSHFSELLGRSVDQTEADSDMLSFINSNIDMFSCPELDKPFTRDEFLYHAKKLKNNKAGAFDLISN